MASDDDKQPLSDVPWSIPQNPSPFPVAGEGFYKDKSELVARIMSVFRAILPSNYVSSTNGPWYTLQFQAIAEELATLQIEVTEEYKDVVWDFTRPEFLWQILGTMVFPDTSPTGEGVPILDGDVAYRTFLTKMAAFLLQGATRSSMASGLEALDPGVTAHVLEKFLSSPPRDPTGAWTIENQFEVEIFIENNDAFPVDPFIFQENAKLVLEALKPAHVFYSFSYLFTDAFGVIATDEGGLSLDLESYYYDDMRKWCLGAKEVSGVGEVLENRFYFRDVSKSFASIQVGADFHISSGDNEGHYRVVSISGFLGGADSTARWYSTSPSGLTGKVTVLSDTDIFDAHQDWGACVDGEVLTINAGSNAGSYRLETVLGPEGGPVGELRPRWPGPDILPSGTVARISKSTLKVDRRIPVVSTTQAYTVTADRLGVRVPQPVSGEDASEQFYL
jgi:hypothetical protein